MRYCCYWAKGFSFLFFISAVVEISPQTPQATQWFLLLLLWITITCALPFHSKSDSSISSSCFWVSKDMCDFVSEGAHHSLSTEGVFLLQAISSAWAVATQMRAKPGKVCCSKNGLLTVWQSARRPNGCLHGKSKDKLAQTTVLNRMTRNAPTQTGTPQQGQERSVCLVGSFSEWIRTMRRRETRCQFNLLQSFLVQQFNACLYFHVIVIHHR